MSLQSMITAFDFFTDCSIFAILLSIAFLFVLHFLISLTNLVNDYYQTQENLNSAFYHQTKDLMQPKTSQQFVIDAGAFLDDVTANYIFDSPDHDNLPPDIFETTIFSALNDLIDDFAQNTDRYLNPQHLAEIDRIAADYLSS